MPTAPIDSRTAVTPWDRSGRLMLVLGDLESIALFAPTLIVTVLVAVSIAFTPLGLGIFMLVPLVPALAWIADRHRRRVARGLGEPVHSGYRSTVGMNALGQVRVWAADPTRWQDFAWALVSITVGVSLSFLVIALLLAPLWYFVWFWLWLGLRDVFDEPYVFQVQSVWVAAVMSVVQIGLSALLFWWFAAPISRLRLGLDARLLGLSREAVLVRRVEEVTSSRSATVDASAAELRRVERDLHDGAQARLVALGMSLGLAEELISRDPQAAVTLLAEARGNANAALQEIRSVVHGIHPPVPSDRGVGAAVHALSIDMPLPVAVQLKLTGRLTPPLESALYFSVSECLANIGKHARATHAWVTLVQEGDLVRVEVGDDGTGGAATDGSGLPGSLDGWQPLTAD